MGDLMVLALGLIVNPITNQPQPQPSSG